MVAFHGQSWHGQPLGLFFYFIGNGLELTGIYATTDDKEVSEKGKPAEVKDEDVPRLFLVGDTGK
jgi:hypothetical protein